MINRAACDHMVDADTLFCDLGRDFPRECRMCMAYVAYPDRVRERNDLWNTYVVVPAQANQNDRAIQPIA